MRKGQVAGQIFIYIIAIVVVGFILLYGYSAIKNFRERGDEVEFISLKTNIESSVKSIASDYGSVRRPDFAVPGKYTEVCFVDRNKAAAADISGLCDSTKDDYEPIACEGWKTKRYNVFLIPDGSEGFDVGEISIYNAATGEGNAPYICVPVVNGKLRVTLTGKGDRVQVEEYVPEDAPEDASGD
jgi:hypothetical protein